MTVRLRVAALWATAAVLIAAGFGASWAAALYYAERIATFTGGPIPEPAFNWASVFSALIVPLLLSGFVTVLIAIVTHWALWRPAPREP